MENDEKNIKNFELDEAATQLLKTLEKENKSVRDFLIKSYNGIPINSGVEEEVYNYCITHSIIFASAVTNPGTSVLTEFLYEGIPSPSPFDNYFLQSKAGRAVKARLLSIEKELPKIIDTYRSKGDVLIGNLGSGPGRDVINVFSAHYQNISNIKAINIDKDINALRRGKIMATKQKVNHLVEFVQENFLTYNSPQKFNILLLVGILCPLDSETCINILKTIKKNLKEGGCLIASNAAPKMQEDDPFTCHIMEWGPNWKMVFKDKEELRQIYEKAGYIWKGYFLDSYGFHTIGIGTPLSYF